MKSKQMIKRTQFLLDIRSNKARNPDGFAAGSLGRSRARKEHEKGPGSITAAAR